MIAEFDDLTVLSWSCQGCNRTLNVRDRKEPGAPRISLMALRRLAVVEQAVHDAAGHPNPDTERSPF